MKLVAAGLFLADLTYPAKVAALLVAINSPSRL